MLLESESAAFPVRADPDALFEEARRRRRRRWLRLVAVAATVIAGVSGAYSMFSGGTSHRAPAASGNAPVAARSPKLADATVYFSVDASRSQESAVARKLESDSMVTQVTFVSKAAAFAQMKRADPRLTAGLAYNPLPDTFRVTLMSLKYVAALRAKLTPLPPGVQTVGFAR